MVDYVEALLHKGSTIFVLVVTVVGQLLVGVSWAVHQEARITALENGVAANRRYMEELNMHLGNLLNRVDRQETPLSRRVDAFEIRFQGLNDKVITLEGRLNELQRASPR